MTTAYHAKYFAHDLSRRGSAGLDRLSMSLFDAAVDLNPHQIEAALFALQSPLSKGVILADEVGLGKTIEAGIVLCQFWAERKRRLLVFSPASIRKQWALELSEKFNLPSLVLDAKAYREIQKQGRAPLAEKVVIVMSFNFANRIRDELKAHTWDLVVIDEAHKLRNAYRPSNKVGQGTQRLLDSVNVRDETIDGLLVHGDNFQGLRLLTSRFAERVKCIYIDPPYNTASSAIPYKNDYRHSAFATMIFDRIRGLHELLSRDGAIFVSIDKTERTVLEHILDSIFGVDNRIEELIWAMNTNNSQAPNYSTNHEYVLVYAKHRPTAEQDRLMFREPKPGFKDVMELAASLNEHYPPIAEIEAALRKLYEQHKIDLKEELESQGFEWEDEKGNDPWKGLYNYSHAEYRTADGKLVSEAHARNENARIWVWQEDNTSMPAAKQAASTRNPEHPNYRFYRPLHPTTGKEVPHPKSGWKFAYDDDEDSPDKRSFVSLDRDGRIAWGPDENKVPRLKRMLHEVETNVGKSVFSDYSDGEKQTSAMFGQSGLFLAPKHADFVSRFILHGAKDDSTVVDCFGGSGSTAHAVIKLNRADRGKRRFVLIEVADYFDRVLKPRVLKAIYSPDWRSGRPVSRQGLSQCVKIIRVESYEDALNNLELRRNRAQQTLLDSSEAQGQDKLREQYVLRYMLNVETDGSPSLLNIRAFTDPTKYLLRVKRPGSDESREINVDLLETFNWLIGLTVQHIAAPQCFAAEFERDVEHRLQMKMRPGSKHASTLREKPDGKWWFRTVTGTLPDGRRALIIWRKRPGGESPEGVEEDNLVLDYWLKEKLEVKPRDIEFDLIYVNGTNNLENLRAPDDTWKVRLIEDDFHRLMFASEGI